uniref:Uncharacterized protein n=1 Tax=Rhizophora mucronata TaxID=61149 RepID=A0A2P2PVQ5_RHIMU
MICKILLGYL